MIQARKQNTTTYPIVFLLVDSNDHVTGKTGLGASPVVTLSKNGNGFGAALGVISEIEDGWYALTGDATDRDTLGSLAIHIEATGADPCDLLVLVVEYDPFTGLGSMLGTGAVEYTPSRAVDPSSDPIDGVDTIVNTSATNPTVGRMARGYTNALGLIDPPFWLDPGTYYVWRQHGLYSFTNPETVTVT
jgi:hypothetical protein